MTDPSPAVQRSPLQSLLRILAWFVSGGLTGYVMARWLGSNSDWALTVSVMMIPISIWIGWGLIFVAALVSFPFLLPKVLRRAGRVLSRAESDPPEPPADPIEVERRRLRIGWAFVFACVPTCFVAGLISGAAWSYLLVGLAFGLGMRRSQALQDIDFE